MGGQGNIDREGLNSLVVDYLVSAGVKPDLVAQVEASLTRERATGKESALVHLLQSVPSRTLASWFPRAAHAEPRDANPECVAGATPDGRTSDAAGSVVKSSLELPIKHDAPAGLLGRTLPVLLVAVVSLVFLPCVTYSEWYIDELFATVRNADARGETPLLKLLSHDFWGNNLWDGQWTHKSYRPLVILSYAFQYFLNGWGIKPQPLRAFNVALHMSNSLLLYATIRRQGVGRRWAFLGSSLFAAHPVHAENAIYLVGRADAMATFCWLLALLTWPSVHNPNKLRFSSRCLHLFLAALLAVIGGLCKESGFCVLLQLAVYELTGPRPFRGGAPLMLAFGIVYKARSWLTQGPEAGFSFVDTPVQYNSDILVRTFTYLYFHAKYAQLMVFPWALSWDYSYNALPVLDAKWLDVRFLAVLTAYLGVVAVAAGAFGRRKRRTLVGLSNVLIPFVPASNLFFIVGVTVGERLLYPCNMGWAMIVAAAGTVTHSSKVEADRPKRQASRSGNRVIRFVLGIALLSVYVYRCSLRVHQWSNRELLFAADAASFPRSTKTRHQYATALHQMGRFDEALVHFKAAHSIFKDSALTEYCIAQIYIETGRAREALAHFENIINGHGMGFGSFNLYALYVDYGFTLMMLQRFEEALPPLQQGLRLNEDVPHGLNALGYSLMQLQRRQEAQAAFQRGLHYDPTNPWLLNNMGVAMVLTGGIEQGSQLIVQAATAEPSVPAFVHNVQFIQALVTTSRWPAGQLALELFFNRGG